MFALQLVCASLAQADIVYTNTRNRHAQIDPTDTNQEAISYLAIYIITMCIPYDITLQANLVTS